MRTLLIFILFVGMIYFAYHAFQGSEVVTSDTSYEDTLREEGLAEFDDGPVSTREAFRELNSEGDTFIDSIQGKIAQWRIEIAEYIDAHI